jgi:hypothetical protein
LFQKDRFYLAEKARVTGRVQELSGATRSFPGRIVRMWRVHFRIMLVLTENVLPTLDDFELARALRPPP